MNKIIGQDKIKNILKFYVSGYEKTHVIPHLLFVGEKGGGKTLLARALAKQLKKTDGKNKPLLEINCSSIKSVKQFFSQIVVPYIVGNELTVLFDEASELPKDLTMALLTIINPNENHENKFMFDGSEFTFDFKKITFLFATTEPQKIFHALLDRMNRLDMEPYTPAQLAKIVALKTGIKYDAKTLMEIASVVRGNPRSAQKMSSDIVSFAKMKNVTKLQPSQWFELKKILDILPLGLSRLESQVLNLVKTPMRLTDIAASSGMTPSAIQNVEVYLLRNRLIEMSEGKRKITAQGMRIIQAIA